MQSRVLRNRFMLIGVVLINLLILLFLESNTRFHRVHMYSILQTPSNSPRIFCLILTTPKYFSTRTKAVNATWGRRCDGYYFISELHNENLTTEQMNIAKQLPIAPIKTIIGGYNHLTLKSNLAFLFAYEHHLNDFDWFVKADDDTFLIVDHLKTFLREQNSSEPVTFGYNFKIIVPKGYHSGGASYVLSRESLRRFHAAYTSANSSCQKDGGSEDVAIANCLRTKGVYPGKSLDKKNREIFHALSFISHFREPISDWLPGYAENPPQSVSYSCMSIIFLLSLFWRVELQLLQWSKRLISLRLGRRAISDGFSLVPSAISIVS